MQIDQTNPLQAIGQAVSRALSTGLTKKRAIIKAVFPEIAAAKQYGFKRQEIVNALNAGGLEISLYYYKDVLEFFSKNEKLDSPLNEKSIEFTHPATDSRWTPPDSSGENSDDDGKPKTTAQKLAEIQKRNRNANLKGRKK